MYDIAIWNKIEKLPESAKREVLDFAEFLLSKYGEPPKKRLSDSKGGGKKYVSSVNDTTKSDSDKIPSKFREFRGVASVKMSTDEIMALTRGEE